MNCIGHECVPVGDSELKPEVSPALALSGMAMEGERCRERFNDCLRRVVSCVDGVFVRHVPFSCVRASLIWSCLLPLFLGLAVWGACQGIALGATALDHFVAPGEVPVNSAESFAVRLHNQSGMPQSCSRAVPTDAVENVFVVAECLAWCRDSLGPGSGFPFAFSPWHWRQMKEAGEAVETSFKMCWQVEAGALALRHWQLCLVALSVSLACTCPLGGGFDIILVVEGTVFLHRGFWGAPLTPWESLAM